MRNEELPLTRPSFISEFEIRNSEFGIPIFQPPSTYFDDRGVETSQRFDRER